MAPKFDNIKVAVRVRPFNDREKKKGSKLIVSMTGQTTLVINPEVPKEEPRKFNFDYSFWSHDGFKPNADGYNEPIKSHYTDQDKLFKEIGVPMLKNAFDGYNCSIFAYGQTGSGKSYSIMGHGTNKGLVPRVCEKLFADIKAQQKPGVQYEVTFSMLEIYNEHVRDLLTKKKSMTPLKIKERPEKGFFVEGLTVVPVASYLEIKLRMQEGDRHRTIAATKMNETSSRAHTIVSINFAQKSIREKMTKHALINLVDLAGSERAKQTEASGDRFEEAKNINKSLLTLGNVIKGLCDRAKGNKAAPVPYRDSTLTKLLKSALVDGNSKTFMIAAISPDAENYEQTLSTLRYADKAKSIKMTAKVNETATDKLIKELIGEKERLLRELESAKSSKKDGLSDEERQKLREEQESEIRKYQEEMEDMEKAWQKRLEEAQKEMQELMAKDKKAEAERKLPHLSNLNEDPALEGKIIHVIKSGTSSIGNSRDGAYPDVTLNGPRIAKDHGSLSSDKMVVSLIPSKGLVLHNGHEITKSVVLHHQDRLRFGSNNLFVFINPSEEEKLRKKGKVLPSITYAYAQNEIAKHSGLNVDQESSILQEEVISIMQMVQDVNAMAEDMDKHVEFSILLVSAEARGADSGRTEVHICMLDTTNNNEYYWNKNKFLIRQSYMQEIYNEFCENGEIPNTSKESDPFWEPADTETPIGVVIVPLKFLSHMLDFQEEPLTVINYRAKPCGYLRVDLIPCDGKGNEEVDLCVDDPMDLLNNNITFKIKIHQGIKLPERFAESWCRYRFYNDSDCIRTNEARGNNPNYGHVKMFQFNKKEVDHRFVDYLREKSLTIEIWGKQQERKSSAGSHGTKAIRRSEEKLKKDLEEANEALSKLQSKMARIEAIIGANPKSAELLKIKKIVDEN